MYKRQRMKLLMCMTIITMLFSCAGFRETREKNYKEVQLKLKEKSNVYFKVESFLWLTNKKEYKRKSNKEKFIILSKNVLNEINNLNVVDEIKNSNIQINYKIKNHTKGSNIWSILTIGTLYLIPNKISESYQIEAVFFKSGKKIGKIVKNETITVWQHLSMLLFVPFKHPYTVMNDIIKDLNRSIIAEAVRKKYLK